ncbi:MAG: hypothetical protein DMF64_22165 [Acidobacteria bacterium]|nr:MAG: hypothetical protein DMF64_22165 [Acidobacteriota bacterium]
MDKVTLRDAIYKLDELAHTRDTEACYALGQAVSQFNSLLVAAKELYLDRADIQGMHSYEYALADKDDFKDAIARLRHAIDLRPHSSAGDMLAQIQLPPDAPSDVALDIQELAGAISLGLHKSALLLAGSIAEALLITRHPNKSERGPGLNQLVNQAREQRLFGRDTLRYLETLVEYRDLIHPRAEARNQTMRNKARVEAAVTALKLLCDELAYPDARYE